MYNYNLYPNQYGGYPYQQPYGASPWYGANQNQFYQYGQPYGQTNPTYPASPTPQSGGAPTAPQGGQPQATSFTAFLAIVQLMAQMYAQQKAAQAARRAALAAGQPIPLPPHEENITVGPRTMSPHPTALNLLNNLTQQYYDTNQNISGPGGLLGYK